MKKFITIGIAGHADHGKTALVRGLTGIDTDRTKEEKRRGLSIESGVAPLILSSGVRAALIDVPGHADYLKNTVRGLSSVDMGILVIAANDGVMPQTLEHLELFKLFKAKTGFCILSKVDLVDEETAAFARLEIDSAVAGTFLEGKPVFSYSAVDQRGAAEIKDTIGKEIDEINCKKREAPFRLLIDQVKSVTGFGTIASGTIVAGTISQEDPVVELQPSGVKTRIRFMESHRERIQKAVAGQRIGVNLHNVQLKDVKRGMTLSKPETLGTTLFINVNLKILETSANPVRNQQRLKLFLGTSVNNARLVLMDREQLAPGESGLAQFRFRKPVAALPEDSFVVSLLNVNTIIGGGSVLEITREKFRAVKAPRTVPYLKTLRLGDLNAFCDCIFNTEAKAFIKTEELARRTGFSFQEIEREITRRIDTGELVSFDGDGVYNKDYFERLKNKIFAAVKQTIKQNSLKNTRTIDILNGSGLSIGDTLFQRILKALCDEGKLIKTVRGFQVPNQSVTLTREQEKLYRNLLDYAMSSGVVPFTAGHFCYVHGQKYKKSDAERLLDYLCNLNEMIRLKDGQYLSCRYLEEIKEKVKQIIHEEGGVTINNIKEVLGNGRNKTVLLLEYLDDIGFTSRQGDVRVIKA